MGMEKTYDNIKVSINISVYNTEKYVSRCIESIIGQGLENYELIIVDDCSTDHSYQILKEWERKISQIKLFQNEKNMGAGFTKNRGMNLCTGKYICFVDSDDWIKEDSLKKLLEMAEELNCDAIYYGEESRKEERTEDDDATQKLTIKKIYANGIELFENMPDQKKVTVSVCHYFIRRDAIDKRVSFSENTINDDWIFTVFFLCSIEKIIVLENDLYVYYQRISGSISSKVKKTSMIKEIFNHAIYIWRNIENTNDDINRVKTKCFLHMMIDIHNDFILRKHNSEMEYNEIKSIINKDQEIKGLFEKSRYLSAYGDVCNNKIEELKQVKRVYIYGTGNYGIDTYRVLYMYNISVDGFVETHKKNNMMFNVPVYSLDEFVEKKIKEITIIAVSDKYKNEIFALLEKNNITNYCSIFEDQ